MVLLGVLYPSTEIGIQNAVSGGLCAPFFSKEVIKMDIFSFYMPTRLYFGNGAVKKLARARLPQGQYQPGKRPPGLERELHPLHGLHLQLPRKRHRIRQSQPGKTQIPLPGYKMKSTPQRC